MRTTEQHVAFACGCIALVFVVVFPMTRVFDDWMYGGTLSWVSGWAAMSMLFAWAFAPPRSGVARVAGRSH